MNLAHPIESLVPGPRGVILELLAATFEPLTGNQIAALSGGRVAQTSVSRIVADLVRTGLVTARPAGRAILYELNRQHLLAAAVESAVSATDRPLEHLRERTAAWSPGPVAVWLFGSAARGSAGPASDVDLLVVRPSHLTDDDSDWEQNLLELAEAVHALSGNACEVLEYTVHELAELVEANDPLISSMPADAISLAGPRPAALLKVPA